MSVPDSCDVAIIGGGPAGSTAATLLARDGFDVVVLERLRHPRPTVGESLLPHAWRFFDLLGVTDTIEREGFIAKQGGTVVWDGRIRQIAFSDFGFTRPGLHTERDRLDFLLLDHSRRQGARICEEAPVQRVDLTDPAAPVLHYQTQEGPGRLRCRYLIDASGQAAVLSRQLDMRRIDEDFRFVALWGYFEGSGYVAADGCVHPFAQVREVPPTTFVGSLGNWGWAWHIPMRDLTSVGLVIPLTQFKAAKAEEEGLAAYYLRTLEQVPYLGDLVRPGRFRPDGFHVIRDYSYVPGKVAGPGYYIVGDAAAFVDPVFSLGVVLGLYSGHLAAWAIARALGNPARAAGSQALFARQFRGRYELARAMAIPGRDLRPEDRQIAGEFIGFQSRAEQDLMYTAALLTTRSDNFRAIAGLADGDPRLVGKYRELDSICFPSQP